jgi:hypothetical protein
MCWKCLQTAVMYWLPGTIKPPTSAHSPMIAARGQPAMLRAALEALARYLETVRHQTPAGRQV